MKTAKGGVSRRGARDVRSPSSNARIALLVLDDKLLVRGYNATAAKLFKLGMRGQGRKLADLAGSVCDAHLVGDVRASLKSHKPIERRVSWPGGAGYHTAHMMPFRDEGAKRVAVALVDIRGVAEAEEDLKSVAADLSHRMKNTLAVVASMANQTMRNAKSLDEFSKTFLGRLLAMASTHDLLAQRDWTEASLRDLIEAELKSYSDLHHERVQVSGPDIALKPRAVQTLGIVLHELATNAARYGALSAPRGSVRVAWEVAGRGAGRHISLVWTESGGPPPPAVAPKRGFGWDLIERGISFELDGSAVIELTPAGLLCTITLPANSRAATPRARGGS